MYGTSTYFTRGSVIPSAWLNDVNQLTYSISQAYGSGIVGFQQSGTGAISRTVQDKLREVQVSVTDFGAVANNSTDCLLAFQRARDYVASLGGGVVIVPPALQEYYLSGRFEVTQSNVLFRGYGGARYHDGGIPTYASRIRSASTSEAVWFYTPQSVSNAVRTGGGWVGIDIDCAGVCTQGLRVTSWRAGDFKDSLVTNATADCHLFDCWNSGTLAEAADNQFNNVVRLSWRVIDSAGVRNANGIRLDGSTDTGANTSFNFFQGCIGQTYNGRGWLLVNADNNQFIGCAAVRANGTVVPGLEIRGYPDANHFWDFSCGGLNGIWIKGTASGYAANSTRNTFLFADGSNGTQYPVIDAGCRVFFWSDSGVITNARAAKLVVGPNETVANQQHDLLTNESMRIQNGSQNHAVLTDGTNSWGVAIDGSGNLRFLRIAGTGGVNVGNGAPLGFFGTAPVAKPTVTGAKGGNAALTSLLSALAAMGLITDSTT